MSIPEDKRKKRADIIRKKLKELFPEAQIALSYSNPMELLVAVILSAQSTDKQINKITSHLFKKYTSVEDYARADKEEFENDIQSSGFFRNKAKSIIGAAQKIKEEYGGDVPDTMEDLTRLPGIGRKSANVILHCGFGKNEGIPVDTHVIRLSKKFGLTEQTNPEKIEKDLIDVIPRNEWGDFSLRLIQYGRKYSPAHKKKDTDDPISTELADNNLLPE